MTRPPRQIDDWADVPVRPVPLHPMLHQPDRPWWTCNRGCGDWPCSTFRTHVLAALDRAAVLALMEDYYPAALVELGEADLVDRRLFAWARHEGVRRPAGGPW